ncbi:MAG TPA: hypothetical protein VGV93_00020 [Acidimicrobiales bacterium]|nr:hypothetical protein [Acidimicrobiales bacterium]
MARPERFVISRRGLLLAGAGSLMVAACGGGDEENQAAATTTTAVEGLMLAPVFYPEQPAGVPVRLPLALADGQGALLDNPPAELSVRVGNADAGELGEAVVVERHDRGVPRAYFPLTTIFSEPGNWRIATQVDGVPAQMTVAVLPPGEVPAVPVVGEPLISVPTPTVADPRGVDPICTAEPDCPLHAVSLDTAIGGDKAIALLIATPAYCQTAICGPVLDLLVSRAPEFADTVTMIHAEVYISEEEAGKTTTDVVRAYGLAWEPSLFLALPDGTIAQRLDYTFDERELDQALSTLVQ